MVQLNFKISRTTENQQCYYHSPGPSQGDLVGWFLNTKLMTMITLNKELPDGKLKPIVHKGDDPERINEIMTKEELHAFGVGVLVGFFHNQRGKLFRCNHNISNDYPHIVVESPKDGLLYVWVKTEMYPIIPSIVSIENQEEVVNLANQFNAIPVFAGIRLTCISTEENNVPIFGAKYIVEFTGLKIS
jgi:hypothetical protein